MAPPTACRSAQCKCKCKIRTVVSEKRPERRETVRSEGDAQAPPPPAQQPKLVIGINGFGRIGRLVARSCVSRGIPLAVINEPFMEPDYILYNLKHDSVHGKLAVDLLLADDGSLWIGDQKVSLFREKSPESIPWADSGVTVVVESTGLFTTLETAGKHLGDNGTLRVIITAPSSDAPMFVVGVNHQNYRDEMKVISNASCTTNCLAPLAKVLHEVYGIEEGLMTTIHSYTATQKVVDGPSVKDDWRGGRAGALNIIPSSTGAAKAVGLVIPELNGKLTGMALRIPSPNVSVVDLTVRLTKGAPYSEIIETLKKFSDSEGLVGILSVVEDSVVSRDLLGDTHSCVVDADAGIGLNDNFVKIVAWYDNEFAYSNRVLDLAIHVSSSTK